MEQSKTTDASGGGEKRYSVPALDHVRRIQALGAAISRRNWQGVEQAHAAIRDAFDRPDIYDPQGVAALASAPPAPTPEAESDLAEQSLLIPDQAHLGGGNFEWATTPVAENYAVTGEPLYSALRPGQVNFKDAFDQPAEDLAGLKEHLETLWCAASDLKDDCKRRGHPRALAYWAGQMDGLGHALTALKDLRPTIEGLDQKGGKE